MQYIYKEVNKSALERLGRHGTFKSWAIWSVRDGKGLEWSQSPTFVDIYRQKKYDFALMSGLTFRQISIYLSVADIVYRVLR